MRSHGRSGCQIWWSLLAHGSKLLTTNATGVLTVLSAINIKKCCYILQQATGFVWEKGRFRVNLSKLMCFWFIPMCPTRTCLLLQKLWQICCYLYIRFCNSFICHSGETPAKIGMDSMDSWLQWHTYGEELPVLIVQDWFLILLHA